MSSVIIKLLTFNTNYHIILEHYLLGGVLMDKFKEIRPITLGIVVKDGKILASRGYDKIKNSHFYRCLGGGIEFMEKSDATLKREFMEEIDAEVTVGDFLGVSENIFTFNGQTGHELILLYSVAINDDCYKEMYFIEGNKEHVVEWIDIDKVKSGEILLYPIEVLKYL